MALIILLIIVMLCVWYDVAELLQLCVYCTRPRSTAGGRRHNDDSVGVEWLLSRGMCDTSAVHDHALLHHIRHRRHSNATPHGHYQVGQTLCYFC